MSECCSLIYNVKLHMRKHVSSEKECIKAKVCFFGNQTVFFS